MKPAISGQTSARHLGHAVHRENKILPARRAPDFILIGAMKCGTSTLQAQLAVQPGVFMSTPKEPNFFSNDEIFAQGDDWYNALFATAPADALTGEASTHYTKLPTYPQTLARMRTALPELKLIYMIRNPVTRAVSHYIHEWTERRASGDADAAFRSNTDFVDYGRYGMQITPYIETYGAQNVLLTSLEAVQADADAEFARIAAFLNLPGDAAWRHDLEAQNISNQRMRKLPLQGLLIDNPVAAFLRRALVPAGLRQRIRAARQMDKRPDIPADLRTGMEAAFLDDREILAGYFPGHAALDLCYPFRPT